MTVTFNSFFSTLASFIEAGANAFVERQLSRIAGGVGEQKII